MEFNQLILFYLGDIFTRNHLLLVEERDAYLKFESPKIIIIICYNPREFSNYIFFYTDFYTDSIQTIEFHNDIIQNVLNSKITIDQLRSEDFAKNLKLLFENEGRSILEGDPAVLESIKKYNQVQTEIYNYHFLKTALLSGADKYWEQNDHNNFIKTIDKLDMNRIPESYRLKYNIALKTIEK